MGKYCRRQNSLTFRSWVGPQCCSSFADESRTHRAIPSTHESTIPPRPRLYSSVTLRDDANLRISVVNPLSGGDEVRDNVIINPSDTVEQDESAREPPHHLALKWEGSKKASILQILNDMETTSALKKKKYKGVPPRKSYRGEDSGQWITLLCMECRGLEPKSFSPMKDEFIIQSEGGFEFTEDVEFDDGEWADYDAENDAAVSLSQVEFKFISV